MQPQLQGLWVAITASLATPGLLFVYGLERSTKFKNICLKIAELTKRFSRCELEVMSDRVE